METVTLRISEADKAILTKLEEKLNADRTELLRRLIQQGLSDWRQENALEQLRDHEITLRKAADFAGISYDEMLMLAGEEGIDIGYMAEDLLYDLGRI